MIRICPECSKKISSLRTVETGSMEGILCLGEQGDIQYGEETFESDNMIEEYHCYEYDEVLFTSKAEAIAFLKGE